MTRSKFVSILGILLLMAVGALFFFRKPEASPPAPAVEAATTVLTSTAIATSVSTSKPMERVIALYETESKRIGRVDPDPALTEKRLTEAAGKLSREEIEWLGQQGLDEKNEMDARFFATYLAALAHSGAAVGTLRQIATRPIPRTKNEMRFAEERALRMQAVEGLAHNCKLEGATDSLMEIVAVEDEAVRDRAHRALYACQTGKKLEDGDREALEKLKKKAK